MILIMHHNADGNSVPVAVVDDNATPAHVDKIIIESFDDWCLPPAGNYKLVRHENDSDFIHIEYEGGYVDYDGDGSFQLFEVSVK